MNSLKPTTDRKTQAYTTQKNTFGLLPGPPCNGGTCPGATFGPGGCQYIPPGRKTPVCYVESIIQCRKATENALEHNTKLVIEASYDETVMLLVKEFRRFRDQERKHGNDEMNYRLHWSGDIPTVEYAEALKEAVEMFPDINFWNYTRSFFVLDILKHTSNLRCYLSLDDVNWTAGMQEYGRYRNHETIHLSYMGPECPEGFVPCPVDNGQRELKGACHECKLCLKGKHVWFKMR